LKKLLALAILIALVGILTFGVTGCKNGEEIAPEQKVEEATEQYACPMKCEDDKTYPKAGDCPVCGMALKKVE
jgi:Cu2+-exporting ATPase